MADKEFTQICKEILGIGKRLEKIEPDELREIKASIERLSEAFNASKASFDDNKNDFDSKYNKVAQIIATFDTLKAQIEEVLKSGAINDDTNGLISTYSSKKIVDLLNEAKVVIDEKFSTIHKNGITPWSSTLEYPAGAISVLNGKLYQAKSENTNKNPSENKEIWSAFASKEWSEQTFLNKNEKIDAYTKKESDKKFALKDDLPELATEEKTGVVKLKNAITAKQEDAAVTEKAVSDLVEANKSIGIDQSWQDVKNQRQNGVIYTNTTGRTIMILVSEQQSSSSQTCELEINGKRVLKNVSYGAFDGCVISAIIPAGATYKVIYKNYPPLEWWELR